ncbi:MAG: adenylate/guanylate cyclase domain-containing protein [Chloroflexota bacterium]|nr:response regulator [Chloroflexota bacterium]
MNLSGNNAITSASVSTTRSQGFGSDGKRKQPRILVVDDIVPNVELLEALLSVQGYDVSMAYDGYEALEKALTDDPDLILLDVMMPGMNGYEVCEQLKRQDWTRSIPIVLLTALDQMEDKVRGLDAGADDFLTKPFNKIELLSRVRSLLRIRSYYNEIEQNRRLLYRLLNRYMSEEIVTAILADPDNSLKLGGEKKEVAVLFADIRGFTSFAEKTTAEEVVEVLNECFNETTEAVFDNYGTFDKYVGDCILAFYGAPISDGNDLQRALRTALDMQRRFALLLERWTDPARRALGLGIGVHIGEVVVGNIGSQRLMDYTIIGDNVNTAQRLEQVAQRGQVIISETAYERAKSYINAKPMPPIYLKGKSEPVTTYLVESFIGVAVG